MSGAKSDAADAVMLANILRLDYSSHRPIPNNTDLARAIKVLARAQQDAVWARTALGNQIRSLLKDFFPAALTAFDSLSGGGITRADARTVLAAALTPESGARLTSAKLRALLRKAGRQRNVDGDAARLRELLRHEQLRQPAAVERAMGIHLQTLVQRLDSACTAVETLTAAATEHVERHPDAQIITSFPCLANVSGARLLAEIGDDRTRFADARGLKANAGASPVTRASGKRTVVLHRQIKTTAWPRLVRSGLSSRSRTHLAHEDTSTVDGLPVTGADKLNVTCSENSSASSIPVYEHGRSTTSYVPSLVPQRWRLDGYRY